MCQERFQYAPIPYDIKRFFLLNDKQTLIQLIMKNIHECYKHIDFKHTLTELRQRF